MGEGENHGCSHGDRRPRDIEREGERVRKRERTRKTGEREEQQQCEAGEQREDRVFHPAHQHPLEEVKSKQQPIGSILVITIRRIRTELILKL